MTPDPIPPAPGRRTPVVDDLLPSQRRATTSAYALAGLLLVAGVAHFVVPQPYRRIVPAVLADPAFWVRWSGVAEIACAGLVAHPRTRRHGAAAAAVLFVVVFPANVKMALDANSGFPWATLAWLRLPLQVPLVVWAARVAGRPATTTAGRV